MKWRLFVSCNEAGHVCDKAQYNDATTFEKLALRFHILYCTACRKHSARNFKLTKLMERAGLHTLDEDKKRAMRDLIDKELSK